MAEFVFSPITSQVFLISQLLIIMTALFMVGLAVRAWKNTGIKKMTYLIIAFALFAILHTINYVDESLVHLMPADARWAMIAVTEVAIMVMFILAVIKK